MAAVNGMQRKVQAVRLGVGERWQPHGRHKLHTLSGDGDHEASGFWL